jgi:hypothetical protein
MWLRRRPATANGRFLKLFGGMPIARNLGMAASDRPDSQGTAVPVGAERRRAPRASPRGALYGQISALGTGISIRNLSFGGFAADLPTPLAPGEQFEVEFLPVGAEAVKLTARVAYYREVHNAEGAAEYVTGFAFVHAEPGSRRRVNELIDRVAGILGFAAESPSDGA